MLYIIILIVLGIAAAPSLILAKKPDAKETLDKLVPFQGWLGVIVCLVGIWRTIEGIIYIEVLTIAPMVWIIWMVVAIVEVVLGFIMGFGLINTYVLSRNPKTEEKGQQLIAKLQPLQGAFGIAAIVIGVLAIIGTFIL
ncbi:hypothetical protein [Zophobihabitans entericus]|uniref:Uncharacterized protein n=1 Tax=Zophobihabitans entericus TaxID=1635327 RepID=A0A6G9IAU1_9GAMM|nr:hypothetical protein [Zophobihabitans entericus]QIQ21333.1 hypothetical protein IPMB12_06305 [Zophobihabitans entericus]